MSHGRERDPTAGHTLVEIVLVAALLVIVAGAIGPNLVTARHVASGQEARIGALDAQRVAFERLTREIRTAEALTAVTAQTLDLRVWVPGVAGQPASLHDVRYDCGVRAGDAWRCVRQDRTTGAVQHVVDGVRNSDAFARPGGGRFVRVQLEVRPQTRALTLRGGAAVRGCATGGGALNPCGA